MFSGLQPHWLRRVGLQERGTRLTSGMSRGEGWMKPVERARGAQLVAVLLCALVSVVSLASCGTFGTSTTIPNPPPNEVKIAATVLDHESSNHTPSATTFIAIRLRRHSSDGNDINFQGTDAQTLMCDGVVMRVGDPAVINQVYDGQYLGTVVPQTDQYTCTYLWDNGAQQTQFTIPAVIPNITHIKAPTNRATVPTPGSGDPGLTLTYAPQDVSDASVTATATDFNHQTATSDTGPDTGSVTIAAQRFPSLYSAGWGTLTLTRSVDGTSLSDLGSNLAFASVDLTTYEQVDRISVFWL